VASLVAPCAFPLGGFGGLNAPPQVVNFDPTPNSVIGFATPLAFDVTDDTGMFRKIVVALAFDDLQRVEVVYSGTAFSPLYRAQSTMAPIANGFHFVLHRAGGWIAQPRITVFATDMSGLENEVSAPVLFYPNTAPVVSPLAPSVAAPITNEDYVTFEVTDDSGKTRRTLVYVDIAESGDWELAFDGDVFVGGYRTSLRNPISGGHKYYLQRAQGWQAVPPVHVIAIDEQGLEA
jgi:hypothetical protein